MDTKLGSFKEYLLNQTIEAEEARLYDFVNSTRVTITDNIPTLGVCKKGNLWINENFILENEEHLIGLLLHESLHVYFDHIKTEYPHPIIANIAQDVFINDKILSLGYTLPEGGCTYESCDVPRSLKTSWEIYEYLVENAEKISQETLDKAKEEHDSDVLDQLSESLGESSLSQQEDEGTSEQEERLEELEEISKIIMNDMAYQTQLLKRKTLPEEEPLKKITREIVKILGKHLAPTYTRTFSRLRRYSPKDVVLPATRGYVRKPSVAVYLDTSGSMEGENLDKAGTVLLELSKALNSFQRKYFSFDTSTTPMSSLNNIPVDKIEENLREVSVGGGTDFKEFHENDVEDVALVITDCGLSFDFLEQEGLKRTIIVVAIEEEPSPIQNCSVYQI